MSFWDYLHDCRALLLVCTAGGLFFTAALWLFGLGAGELALLWAFYALLVGACTGAGFARQRRRAAELLGRMEALDQKYLLAEVAEAPGSYGEQLYFGLMRTALKAMTDEVAAAERQNREYREFIEQWVHEVKAPLTAIALLCASDRTAATRRIEAQAERAAQDVERVLYYARLGSVEKDYFIRELSLGDCIEDVLARNRQLLLQCGASVQAEGAQATVYSDEKWLSFILSQLLFNSIQYRAARPLRLDFTAREEAGGVALTLVDNGVGIRASELGRVFDKGFVGSNGRAGRHSTGMGLYLCAQLCARLGLGIEIASEPDAGTEVTLYFPKSGHLRV